MPVAWSGSSLESALQRRGDHALSLRLLQQEQVFAVSLDPEPAPPGRSVLSMSAFCGLRTPSVFPGLLCPGFITGLAGLAPVHQTCVTGPGLASAHL